MPTVLHTLKDADPEAWESLQEMHSGFLHGECYAFAIALHRGLGFDLIGLIDNDGVIQHAMVADPDGVLRDIRGRVSKEEATAPFSVATIRTIEEEALYRTRGIIHDRTIAAARKVAETLWPELPWESTAVQKVKEFTDELEALCRKHGLLVWGAIPAQPPLISPLDEELFQGYSVTPTIHGTTFILKRTYERT